MSVFEVLRYGDIDLANLEHLLDLPDVILLKYWLTVHAETPDEFEPIPPIGKMCSILARWAKSADTQQGKEYVRNKFMRALRELDPL